MNTFIATNQGTNIAPLLISALVIGLLFFLMIVRPQKKNIQRQQELIGSLNVGDEIITSSGIYATIVTINDDNVVLCISEGVNIKVAIRAIAMRKTTQDKPDVQVGDQ